MARHSRLLSRLATVAVVAVTAAAGSVAVGGAAGAATPAAHRISVHPLTSQTRMTPGATPRFGCQSRPMDGSQGPRCYSPQQMQKAYDAANLLRAGLNGSGRTIAIIDAYQNPYVANDLAIFDQTFGLPAADYSAVAPQGVPAFDPNDPNMVGWAEEITLDVLWSHAMAPGAKIVLVEATSNQDLDIYNATKWAVDNNIGDVISQSFGEAEQCVDPTLLTEEHALFAEAVGKGMTLFASSGDSGAAQFNCAGTGAILAASSPASDPLVTGVGGTTLTANPVSGSYMRETAWTETQFGCNPPAVDVADINCSGGGYSVLYSRPAFQNGFVQNGGRGVPDVAYDAGINGGVLTHCGICNLLVGLDPSDPTVFFIFGGTSAGSPQWSALTAIADQLAGHRLGNINPALYSIARSKVQYKAALHDITTGNNVVAEIGTGYYAGPGWDAVTGLGSPIASRLLPLLAARG